MSLAWACGSEYLIKERTRNATPQACRSPLNRGRRLSLPHFRINTFNSNQEGIAYVMGSPIRAQAAWLP
jgi:hypothetical protein